MPSGEGNAENERRGYRPDEPMRALVAVCQLIPKTVWKAHLVPLGMPSWKTRNSVFDAFVDGMGVRADEFEGSSPSIEKVLSVYFSQSMHCGIVVSVDAMSVTPCVTVDFKNGVVRGGMVDMPLSEEQRQEQRERPEVLQEFVATSGVGVVCAM
jgi:hypothetical protein